MSANIGIAAGSAAKAWQEGLIQLLLWQSWPLRLNEIYTHIRVLSWRKGDKNHMVRDQLSMEDMTKWWPVCLASSSWTRTERCAGALSCSNSQFSYAKAQNAYDELNCINNQASPCGKFCLQLHLLDEFHVNNSIWIKKQFKYHLAFWLVLSWFSLSWQYWHFPVGGLSLQLWIIQETPCFVSSYDPVEKHQVTTNRHAIIMLVLCQDVWHAVVGNMRHAQVINQNFVAHIMADPYCCYEVIYQLVAFGMHQHCNLFNLAFSLNHLWLTCMHIILQTVSPLRETSVTPKHNSAAQYVVTINLLYHLKCFGCNFA